MSNYTRSRARQYREEPAERGGNYQRGNGRQYVYIIIAAVIIVILAVVIVFTLKGCSEGASTLPDATQSDASNWTDTPTDAPTDGASATPPDDSATPASSDSATPLATETPTAEDSASPTPTATQTSGSSSSGDDASAITPEEIKGKPDVDEYLSLRSSASSTSSILVKIDKDEELTVLQVSTNKTWLKVKYSDKTGYVLAKYVTVGSGSSDKVCTVTSDTLNVRSGAGKTKDIVGTLKSGDTVIVTDTVTTSGEKWYKIVTGDTTGYIFASNCRLAS